MEDVVEAHEVVISVLRAYSGLDLQVFLYLQIYVAINEHENHRCIV